MPRIKTAAIFLFISSLFMIHAAQDNQVLRQLALSGNVISDVYEVNSRIITLTDGGMISTFSTDGYRKYERPLSVRPSGSYCVTEKGIILSVSYDSKTISFFNPDGYFVWKHTFDDKIKFIPCSGFDGRIFVETETTLYCLGITGKINWEAELKSAPIQPIRTLNDGSLLCICSASSRSASSGYRFSPYGELLEEITFTGKAVNTIEHENGVIILFEDGTLGCCSIKNTVSVSLWARESPSRTQTASSPSSDFSRAVLFRLNRNEIIVLYPDGELMAVDAGNGETLVSLTLEEEFLQAGIYGGNGTIAVITQQEDIANFHIFSLQGETLWEGNRKTREGTIFFYTSDGYLLQFTTDWLLSVAKPYTPITNKTETVSRIKRPSLYGIYTGNPAELYIQDIIQGLEDILTELSPFADAYTGIDPSLITRDFNQLTSCIPKAASAGYDFSSYIGKILRNASSEMYFKAALSYTRTNGYDPDQYILNAIHTFLNTHHDFTLSDSTYMDICDAVCNVCRFTGASVFEGSGRTILLELMDTRYSNTVRQYVVKTLKSLMDLQI